MEETRFGDLLRRLRLAAELSQEELAARAGLSVQAIGALERGVRRAPYRHTLDALASALGLDREGRVEFYAAAERRRGTRPAAAPAAVAAPPASPPAPAGPPGVPDPTLLGREVAFAEVLALVRHAGARLLTIVGPGGVGKTRLALAAARALAPDFADGATVVPLADLRDPAAMAGQVGRALGLAGRAADPAAALRDHLRGRRALLLLDNCEHLPGGVASLVADLLAAAPGLVVLATSRAPLRLTPERLYDLPPLACPDPAQPPAPAALAEYGATALFVARARAARPDLTLTPAVAASIAGICARLDGLPLALELAAARLNVLAPAELLDRLAARLPLLTRGPRDLPERQRALRAALDWSHDLLGAGEQVLFRRLAAFVGGATLAAIEAVCVADDLAAVDLLDALGALVEQRLVRREPGEADAPTRFAMLETIREYAAERLAADPDGAATLRAHTAHFLALAEEAAPHLTGAAQERWFAALIADHDNLRAALRRAIGTGDAATATRLAAALWRFWYRADFWSEGRGWCRAAIALPAPAGDASWDGAALLLARARARRGAGALAVMQSDFAAAQDQLRAALELARRAGADAEAAGILDNLAVLAKERGDYRAAVGLHEAALAARRALGEPRDIAATLNNLGGDHEARCDFGHAADAFAEALALARAAGDAHTGQIALINLGAVTHYLGDYAQARALGEEALARARRLGNGRYVATALTNLGALACDRGEAATAVGWLREALDLVRPLGVGTRLALAHANLGRALRLRGDRAGAAAALAEGLAVSAAVGDDWSIAFVHLYRGQLAEESGAADAARDDYRAALERARRIDQGWLIAAALNQLGALAADPADALASCRESLGRAVAMGTPLLGAAALEGLTVALAATGPARAATLASAAAATRARLGTPREVAWEARVAAAVAAVRAALGEATFAVAWEAGAALDLAAAAVAGDGP